MAVSHCARSPHNTGIQRVVRGLARHLAEMSPVQFVEWRARRQAYYLLARSRFKNLEKFGGPPSPPQSSLAPWATDWKTWGRAMGLNHLVPLHLRPDARGEERNRWLILPELVDEERIGKMMAYSRTHGFKVAAIFYDAIPLLHPEWVNERILKNHAGYMRALAQADLVLPISEFSAEGFRDFLRVEKLRGPEVRACVLPGEWLGQPRKTVYDAPATGPIRLLCLCTLEPRKNHLKLLQALEQLEDLDWELTLVGNAYRGAPEIEKAVQAAVSRNPRIRWMQQVEDETVRDLYQQAHFSIFPSVIEGYGLPIMESLWNARPCVCANFGVMEELARGGGCATTDVRQVKSLAETLRQLMTDAALRAKLADEAIRRPVKTWADYAAEVGQAIQSFPVSKATS
jgi:glycosyltransferase involved in cell wall biosynthesis